MIRTQPPTEEPSATFNDRLESYSRENQSTLFARRDRDTRGHARIHTLSEQNTSTTPEFSLLTSEDSEIAVVPPPCKYYQQGCDAGCHSHDSEADRDVCPNGQSLPDIFERSFNLLKASIQGARLSSSAARSVFDRKRAKQYHSPNMSRVSLLTRSHPRNLDFWKPRFLHQRNSPSEFLVPNTRCALQISSPA